MIVDYGSGAHHLEWAQWNEDMTYTVECSCGERFRRERFADAAVALERHLFVKANLGRNALNTKEATNG